MEDKVKLVMSQVFDVPMTSISNGSSKDNIENWDSLSHMNLVSALEEEFKTTFTDDQVVEMLNYQLICAILREAGIK